MLKKYLLVLFCIYSVVLFSQERKAIDSLVRIINNTKNATSRLETLDKLTTIYWNINIDTAKIYNNLFFKQAVSQNDKTSILTSKIYTAANSDAEGKTTVARNEFQSVYQEIVQSNIASKTILFAKYYYNYGNYCFYNNMIDNALLSYQKSIIFYMQMSDLKTIARINLNIGYIYSKNNNFSKSLEIYQSTIPTLLQGKDWLGLSSVYGRIGYNYGILKMNYKAIEYHKKGLAIDEKYNLINNKAYSLSNIGSEYADLKNYKVAKDYYFQSKKVFESLNNSDKSLNIELIVQLININTRKYSETLQNLLEINKNQNNIVIENKVMLFRLIGKCYYKLKKYNVAENYLKKAHLLSKEIYAEDQYIELSNEYLLASLSNKNDFKSLSMINLIDSLTAKKHETENKIVFFDLETKYQTELKEAKIKTQQLQIQKEQTNKYFAFLGFGILLLSAVGGFIFYRNKQNQTNLVTLNTLLSLQQNLVEAELFSLNKQLDPHEIKNLLASISPEIQEKAPESYKKMLKLFNLTKASLNSSSITDSLENQLQQIDDFLSLEKSMLSISLEYIIENNIQNTETQIPRLLLKNLVENSLKHGIKPKSNGGKITVKINEKDNFIQIAVDDTGIGRQNAISLDSGIGTTTYQKLFATLNPKNKENATFEIIDKTEGTKVAVNIPLDYKYL